MRIQIKNYPNYWIDDQGEVYNETTKKIDDLYMTFTEDKKTNFDNIWNSPTVNGESNN